jgi:NAD(P)-dependent dehydrogenase (short-subunit alcohol dehydrogenase family)
MAEREVVVVTGATGGVGRAVARELARHGADQRVVADRRVYPCVRHKT